MYKHGCLCAPRVQHSCVVRFPGSHHGAVPCVPLGVVFDELGLDKSGGKGFGGGEAGVPGRGGAPSPGGGRELISLGKDLERLGAPGVGARAGRGLTLLSMGAALQGTVSESLSRFLPLPALHPGKHLFSQCCWVTSINLDPVWSSSDSLAGLGEAGLAAITTHLQHPWLWDWSGSGSRNDPGVTGGEKPHLRGECPIPETFPGTCPVGIWYMWLYGPGYLRKEAVGTSLTQSPRAARVEAIPGTFPCAGRHLLMIFCWENSFLEELPAGSVCYCSSQSLLSPERSRDRTVPLSQTEILSTNTSLRLWWCLNSKKFLNTGESGARQKAE